MPSGPRLRGIGLSVVGFTRQWVWVGWHGEDDPAIQLLWRADPLGGAAIEGTSVDYRPKPIDTSAVTLTPDLLQLTERLAANAHDVWAQRRMAEGWTYGPQRDDAAKKHPDLVPYDDLPESEKEYDRDSAMNTLKAIIALGYEIAGPES